MKWADFVFLGRAVPVRPSGLSPLTPLTPESTRGSEAEEEAPSRRDDEDGEDLGGFAALLPPLRCTRPGLDLLGSSVCFNSSKLPWVPMRPKRA